MTDAPRLSQKARLKFDARDGRYLLLYPERGLVLSDSAAAILKLCDGVHTLDAIVDELSQYRPQGTLLAIRQDVVAFLDEMRRRGLIV